MPASRRALGVGLGVAPALSARAAVGEPTHAQRFCICHVAGWLDTVACEFVFLISEKKRVLQCELLRP